MGPTRRGGGSRQLATVASVAELPPLSLSQNAPAKTSKSFHPLLFKSPYDWIVLIIVAGFVTSSSCQIYRGVSGV